MTRKTLVSQADLKRMASIARSEGVRVEVEKDGVIIRVLPDADRAEPGSGPTSRSAPAVVRGDDAPVRTGKKGYAIPDDPNHPLQKWYDSLGFDPRTMGESDMKRLREKAHKEWLASIPGTKLSKRELNCLQQLAAVGLDKRVATSWIKGLGEETYQKLETRGFIAGAETLPPEKVAQGLSLVEVRLLQAGLDAWKDAAGI